MGLKVTAEQAGQLVDRAERIVRGHIKRGTLPAVKVGNSWRIDVDELERIPGWKVDRGRLAQLTERDARTVESMLARFEAMERELEALRRRVRILEAARPSPASTEGAEALERYETRQDEQESLLGAWDSSSHSPSPYRPLESHPSASSARLPTYAPPALPMLAPTREGLPPGSVLMRHFARAHGVPVGTLNSQAEGGKVGTTDIETGARDGRRERWLTPAQQGAVIALWRRQGTQHTPCQDCPH